MKFPVRIKKIKRYFQLKKEATRLMTDGDIKSYFQKLYEIETLKMDLSRNSAVYQRIYR